MNRGYLNRAKKKGNEGCGEVEGEAPHQGGLER